MSDENWLKIGPVGKRISILGRATLSLFLSFRIGEEKVWKFNQDEKWREKACVVKTYDYILSET